MDHNMPDDYAPPQERVGNDRNLSGDATALGADAGPNPLDDQQVQAKDIPTSLIYQENRAIDYSYQYPPQYVQPALENQISNDTLLDSTQHVSIHPQSRANMNDQNDKKVIVLSPSAKPAKRIRRFSKKALIITGVMLLLVLAIIVFVLAVTNKWVCFGNGCDSCKISNGSTSSTMTSTVTAPPQATSTPIGLLYQGCYIDNPTRVFSFQLPNSANNNNGDCVRICFDAGYRFAATQYGVECFCGTLQQLRAATRAPDSECDYGCPGDSKSICGGYFRMSVYDFGR